MKNLLLLTLVIVSICGCAEEPPPLLPAGLPLTEIDTVPVPGEKKPQEDVPEMPAISENGPWPKFVAEELTYSFGQMQVGTRLEHHFKIRNEGDAPLEMVVGKSTCKCTKFEVGKPVLQPGEETTLHIEWKGKNRDASFSHGGPVFTNDPDNQQKQFVVRGIVDSPFMVMPEDTWEVEDVSFDSAGKARGMFCSRIFEDFEILEVKSTSPFVKTSVKPMTPDFLQKMEALSGYFIDVEVAPDMPAGLLRDKIEIVANKGGSDQMMVNITATREGAVRVVGSKGGIWVASRMGLKLGQFPARSGKEAVMTLAVSKDEMSEPLEIVSCETNPKYMVVELVPEKATSKTVTRYQLKVRVPPGAPKTRKRSDNPATVEIKTNHPRGEAFKFQVTMNSF